MTKLFYPAICAAITAVVLQPSYAAPMNVAASSNPFSQLNNEIVVIKNDVASLQDQVNALVGRVDSLEEKVSANSDAIVALQNKDVYFQNMMAQANLDIAMVKAAIDTLRQQNLELQAKIDANSGDIAGMKDRIAYNLSLIDSLTVAIDTVQQKSISMSDALQQQIDYNLSLIQFIQADIQNINNMLDMQQGLVAGRCPNGSAVQEIKADGSFVCVQVAGGGGGVLRVYSKTNYRNWAPSETNYMTLFCDAGDIATGSGHFGYQNVDVLSNYANNYTDNGLNYGFGFVYTTNSNPYTVLVGVVVNCLDTTP